MFSESTLPESTLPELEICTMRDRGEWRFRSSRPAPELLDTAMPPPNGNNGETGPTLNQDLACATNQPGTIEFQPAAPKTPLAASPVASTNHAWPDKTIRQQRPLRSDTIATVTAPPRFNPPTNRPGPLAD